MVYLKLFLSVKLDLAGVVEHTVCSTIEHHKYSELSCTPRLHY